MDAEVNNAWQDENDIAKELVGKPCITVGFLVRKPSKTFPMYMISATMAHDEGAGTRLHNATVKIPKVWVKSIKELSNDRLDNEPEEQ